MSSPLGMLGIFHPFRSKRFFTWHNFDSGGRLPESTLLDLLPRSHFWEVVELADVSVLLCNALSTVGVVVVNRHHVATADHPRDRHDGIQRAPSQLLLVEDPGRLMERLHLGSIESPPQNCPNSLTLKQPIESVDFRLTTLF